MLKKPSNISIKGKRGFSGDGICGKLKGETKEGLAACMGTVDLQQCSVEKADTLF